MPIYEYRCTACGNVFEEWGQHFDSPEHEPCPKCGGDAARIVSNTTFVLKGGGWYVTEYGSHKTDHESGAGAPGEGKGEHKDATADKTAAPSGDATSGDTASAKAPAAADKAAPKAAPAAKTTAAA